MFFNAIDDEMKKLYITDRNKHDILLWIIYNTNYQEEYKDLKQYQCYMSLRSLSESTNIDYSKTQRTFRQLIKEGYISYIVKSKSKYNPSIIQCHFIEKKITLYSNKYLVLQENNNMTVSEAHTEDLTTKLTNCSSNENESLKIEKREPIELSANEQLLKDNAKLNHALNNEQIEQVNQLDTDRLIKAIEQANKFAIGKYSLNYILAIYKNNHVNTIEEPHRDTRGNVVKGAYQQKINTKPLTKYHNTFNEHYKNYTEDELEAKLLKMQSKRKI